MINVLIPVVDNPEKFLNSAKSICSDLNVQIVIGVTESLANVYDFKVPNAIVKVYADGSDREEIINAMQAVLLGEAVFIARKPFTKDEFYRFTSQESQIVVCEQTQKNVIMKFLYGLWCKIVKAVFGVKFFQGDTSLVYFDKNLGNVLTNVSNLSYCTRVDRWRGISQAAIPTREPTSKIKYDKKMALRLLLFAILSIVVGVVVTTVVSIFTKVNIVIGLLLACLDAICLIITFLLLITYCFNMRIGKKNITKAIEMGE